MIGTLSLTLRRYGGDPRVWWRNLVWRRRKDVSEVPIVFVVGAPRSGTTLLQKVIEAHSQCFAHDGETAMFNLQNLFLLERRHFGLEGEALRSAMAEARSRIDFMDRQIRRLGHERSGTLFVEKTPQHVLKLPAILAGFPDAKVVHVVRDGRDAFCSAQSNAGVPQRGSVVRFAKYWRRCVDAGLAFDDDPRLLRISYETFTRDAASVLGGIMGHLGLEAEPGQLDSQTRATDRRADRPEFERLGGEISASSVGRWRNDLPPETVSTFEDVAGPTLRRLGYLD